MPRVLIADDDPVQLRLTAEVARRAGFAPVTAQGGDEALTLLRADPGYGALILDLVMPDRDGMAVMEVMRREAIDVPVIVQTAHSSLDTVVTAMRNGAADFFVKPVAPERLIVSLRNVMKLGELETLVRTERARRDGTLGLGDILTRSPAMHRVLTLAQKAAKSPIPVLIEGETGTGKELVARVIQGMGNRAGRPFDTVNCAAIPANLVESTLFGHRKGAFTGAIGDHAGKFAEANGGTLFLDEIGELPLDTQAMLLRALQEGEIEPVGADRPQRVNVRVVSATNRRLLGLAQSGAFREDLFYRLNVFRIALPPLRDRKGDVTLLAHHFLAELAEQQGLPPKVLDHSAIAALEVHNWPGNIRELKNVIEHAAILSDDNVIRGEHLMLQQRTILPATTGADQVREIRIPPEGKSLELIEQEAVRLTLQITRGNRSAAARILGISRPTLGRKLRAALAMEDGEDDDAVSDETPADPI
jgi:DNA-binding NtrC family response regulator